MNITGFSLCFDLEYAAEYWLKVLSENPGITEKNVVLAFPWLGIALFTPMALARHLGLSTQDAIDFAHNFVKTETSDLGWDTDKTGNSSPAIIWSQGEGFTHPSLDSAARTELIIKLKFDRMTTTEDHTKYDMPCYGHPSKAPETSAQRELALFDSLAV